MATGKKYYWIKLKDSFMTSDKVDFLMSQENGANYIVLYQMLCLECINTEGTLARQIGEIIIPYDVDKIVRDCKYFSRDTVIVAMELYKKLGMIYEQENGMLKIADFDNMVGSETDYAQKKRRQRLTGDTGGDISGDNVPIDNRDKRLEIRDKSKEIKEKSKKTPSVYYPMDETLNQVFLDYIDCRKKMKKPMTDRAIELAMKELEKLAGNDNDLAIQILEQSIFRGWQGLFPLKGEEQKKEKSVEEYVNEWRNA